MPEARDDDRWKHLGEMLQEQRVRLDRRYRNRTLFSAERQLNYRLAQDLETGARTDYKLATLADAEMAYGWEPGTIAAALRKAGAEESPDIDMTPQCEFEREALETPDLSDETRQQIVRVHRKRGHTQWCSPGVRPAEREARTALSAS